MHIVNVALTNDINLLIEYIELSGDNLDIVTYSDFRKIFGECKKDISGIIYGLYGSTDECHSAAIVHNLQDIGIRRLVNINMIPKEDLKIIIESGLAIFSTYHLFGDIPQEYYSLLTLDMIDEDEFVTILPLSHRNELSSILNSNPSLSDLFGPYLSCTLHDCENTELLEKFDRIINVQGDTSNIVPLEVKDSPLGKYLKTGEGKDNIAPENEDKVYITTLREIDLINEFGYELDLELDMNLSEVPDKYLDILNRFEGLNRCLDEADLQDSIRWFEHINDASIDVFLNINPCALFDDYGKTETLHKLWGKYHYDPTLIKLVLRSFPLNTCKSLEPSIPEEYYKFLYYK